VANNNIYFATSPWLSPEISTKLLTQGIYGQLILTSTTVSQISGFHFEKSEIRIMQSSDVRVASYDGKPLAWLNNMLL